MFQNINCVDDDKSTTQKYIFIPNYNKVHYRLKYNRVSV